MEPVIDLNECLNDSPKFRMDLNHNEDNIDVFEVKLDKIVKAGNVFVDTGKTFIKSQSSLITAIWELSVYFNEDKSVVKPLNKIIETLNEFNKYQQMLIDQVNRSLIRSFDAFSKNKINKVKDLKRHYDKISDDYDNVLIRNSQTLKNKQNEYDEINNLVKATRSCYKHTSLDYATQICSLQAVKRHEILHSFITLMQAYGTYFHQGYDLYQDVDSLIKESASFIDQSRKDSTILQKQMEGNHSLVAKDTTVTVFTKGDQIWIEGYLFKRTSNAFKTWNRRWFIIKDSQLVYQRKCDQQLTVMEQDLRLCRVKYLNDYERRFCFEVVSPSKNHVLQADTEEACKLWVNALQAGIDAAYHETSNYHCNNDKIKQSTSSDSLSSASNGTNDSTIANTQNVNSNIINNGNCSNNNGKNSIADSPTENATQKVSSQILSIPGNEHCCDCRSSDTKWASINLGITLCIECSGIHRSLGVHISKVRSLILDDWEMDTISIMLSLGNNKINSIYEENYNDDDSENQIKRINQNSDRSERELWIKAKYVQKRFVCKKRKNLFVNTVKDNHEDNVEISDSNDVGVIGGDDNDDVNNGNINIPCKVEEKENVSDEDDKIFFNKLLYVSASNADILGMREALAKGADINWSNLDDNGKCALHETVLSKSVIATEFLLLNGAKCNTQDSLNRTALHFATEISDTGQVCLLLKRGADQRLLDNEQRDALSIAVNNRNADIVTLLRLAQLNEEMKKDEYGTSHEEIFNEVVRDFSNLASLSSPKRNNEQS